MSVCPEGEMPKAEVRNEPFTLALFLGCDASAQLIQEATCVNKHKKHRSTTKGEARSTTWEEDVYVIHLGLPCVSADLLFLKGFCRFLYSSLCVRLSDATSRLSV